MDCVMMERDWSPGEVHSGVDSEIELIWENLVVHYIIDVTVHMRLFYQRLFVKSLNLQQLNK